MHIKWFPSVYIYLGHYYTIENEKNFSLWLYNQWWHVAYMVGLIGLHAAYSVGNGDENYWVVIPRLVAKCTCWVTEEWKHCR